MPTESHNAKHAAGNSSRFGNNRVNLEIVETGVISCVVGCAPSETDFDQGGGRVTSSAYVKSINVVSAVSRYVNQALRSNGEIGTAICAVPDFHLGELCSISPPEALKRKTK
jgi:hypothetical protein